MRSQEETNVRNLRKRYANYKRLPELRIRRIRENIEEEHQPRQSHFGSAHNRKRGKIGPANIYYKEMDRRPPRPGDIHTISQRERHGARSE